MCIYTCVYTYIYMYTAKEIRKISGAWASVKGASFATKNDDDHDHDTPKSDHQHGVRFDGWTGYWRGTK